MAGDIPSECPACGGDASQFIYQGGCTKCPCGRWAACG